MAPGEVLVGPSVHGGSVSGGSEGEVLGWFTDVPEEFKGGSGSASRSFRKIRRVIKTQVFSWHAPTETQLFIMYLLTETFVFASSLRPEHNLQQSAHRPKL